MADNASTGWPEVYSKAMWEIEDALLAGRIWDVRAEISKCLVELQALPVCTPKNGKPSRMLCDACRVWNKMTSGTTQPR